MQRQRNEMKQYYNVTFVYSELNYMLFDDHSIAVSLSVSYHMHDWWCILCFNSGKDIISIKKCELFFNIKMRILLTPN